MELQEQLNEQFDRIWGLINNHLTWEQLDEYVYIEDLSHGFIGTSNWPISTATEFIDLAYQRYPTFEELSFMTKREVLAAIFTAKDDNGEYLLIEGNKPNPYLLTRQGKFDELCKKAEGDSNYIIPMSLVMGQMDYSPQTFRELYLKNCFAETEKEVKQIKLITW